MKRIIVTLVFFIAILILCYLITSFGMWDLNARNWGIETRAIMMTIAVWVGVMISVYVYIFYEDISK